MYREARKFWHHEFLKFRRCLIDLLFSTTSLFILSIQLLTRFSKFVVLGEKESYTIDIEDPKSEGYIVENYFIQE